MKPTIIATLLVLTFVSSHATAGWEKVVSGKSDTVYADPSSIRKESDNKVKMWHMLDYNSPQQFGKLNSVMSMKRQTEFDCKKPQYRFLYLLYYSKNMGEGDVIGTESKSKKWLSLPLITSAERLRKIACEKNK